MIELRSNVLLSNISQLDLNRKNSIHYESVEPYPYLKVLIFELKFLAQKNSLTKIYNSCLVFEVFQKQKFSFSPPHIAQIIIEPFPSSLTESVL